MPEASLVPLKEIRSLPNNPKEHDLGEIHRSVSRFGFLERIIINRITGHLISGHGRIDTLRQLKASGGSAPHGVEPKNGDWYVPVDYVELNQEEEKAAAIAINRLGEKGGWDEPELAGMLADLATMGEHMLDGVGFDLDDLDQMLARLNLPDEDEDFEDDDVRDGSEALERADELLEKWGVKPGDVWQIGGHYVACGDCRDSTTWTSLFAAAGITKVQGIFTSPPYAQQRQTQYGGVHPDEYVDWWDNVQANAREYLDDGASFFVNIKPHTDQGQRVLYVFDLVTAMVRRWEWAFVDEFSWERISAPGSWPNRFKNGFEPVYQFALDSDIEFHPRNVVVGGEGAAKGGSNSSMGNYYNTQNKYIEWDVALPSNRLPSFGNATGTSHVAAFPVGLPDFFIRAFSTYGDTWLDPFAGSGTVGEAAHLSGHNALLVELLPQFAAVCIERLANTTGEMPTKLVKATA